MRKEVKGYEGLYEVDESGVVYSVRRNRSLNPIKMKSGYSYVHLCNGKNTKLARIHRIVASAFIPNTENKPQVNHINGDKSDNRVNNLEWCDAKYNMRHAQKLGLFTPEGENNPVSKLTSKEVEKIREEYKRGTKEFGICALGEKYGVSDVMISKIVTGKSWKVGFDKARSINRAEGQS